MNRSPRPRVLRPAGLVLAVIFVALAAIWLLATGPVLLTASSPDPGQRVGLEGVEVLVRFDTLRVEPGTFSARLNGADVTASLAVGENGAHGTLHGFVDGPNRLELSVFGRGFWQLPLLLEETHAIDLDHRRPLSIDRG